MSLAGVAWVLLRFHRGLRKYVKSSSLTEDKIHNQWQVSGIGPVYSNNGQIWTDSKKRGLLPSGDQPGPGAGWASSRNQRDDGAGHAMPMATTQSSCISVSSHLLVWRKSNTGAYLNISVSLAGLSLQVPGEMHDHGDWEMQQRPSTSSIPFSP